jgi:hypothetical protein
MHATMTLALVGDRTQPGARVTEEEWNKPWEARPQVELKVADEESLRSAQSLRLEGRINYVRRVIRALRCGVEPP